MPQEPHTAEPSSKANQAPEAKESAPPRRRHYVNPKDPGITVFATTTVLDFVHALGRADMKDLTQRILYRECRLARARLHGFVIMSRHLHLLVDLHEELTAPDFMQRFKSESSKALNPYLSPAELARISVQRGLNRNSNWQRSFRGFKVDSKRLFTQKLRYMHRNPVDARLVESAADYQWSSARLFLEGAWTPEEGLPLR